LEHECGEIQAFRLLAGNVGAIWLFRPTEEELNFLLPPTLQFEEVELFGTSNSGPVCGSFVRTETSNANEWSPVAKRMSLGFLSFPSKMVI